MSTHFRKECEHGTLVSQCRCPASDKSVIIVPCPSHCKKGEATTSATGRLSTASEIAINVALDNQGLPLDRADIVEAIRRDRAQIVEAIEELKGGSLPSYFIVQELIRQIGL